MPALFFLSRVTSGTAMVSYQDAITASLDQYPAKTCGFALKTQIAKGQYQYLILRCKFQPHIVGQSNAI